MNSRAGGLGPFPSAAWRPSASTASPKPTPTSPLGRRRMAPGSMSARSSHRAAGPEDHLTVRAPDGQTAVVRFAIRSFFSSPGGRWWRRGSRFRPRCAPLTSWRRARAHSIRERCRSIRCHQRRIPARSPCPCRSWPSMPASGGSSPRHASRSCAGRRRRRSGSATRQVSTRSNGHHHASAIGRHRGARLAALPPGGNDRALQRDLGSPPRRLVLRRGIPQLDEKREARLLLSDSFPRDARVL